MTQAKPEALRLADELEAMGRTKDMGRPAINDTERLAAAELRRLHALAHPAESAATDKQSLTVGAEAGAARPDEPRSAYSIDADPDGLRERVAHAITGALAFGAQNTSPPPDGHWLTEFWEMARAEAGAVPAGFALVPRSVPDSAFPWLSGGYPAGCKGLGERDRAVINERAQRMWDSIIDAAASPAQAAGIVGLTDDEAVQALRFGYSSKAMADRVVAAFCAKNGLTLAARERGDK